MIDNHKMLRVDQISFDTENPRIKTALEKYGDQLNAERIHFALSSATDGSKGAASYQSLRDSIRAAGQIVVPITVRVEGDKYICVDGNTRLAIYKQFLKDGVKGDWSEIEAIVLVNANQRDIETIRVSMHLVGAREWPAYEKAKYLHYLRNQKFMDYTDMIALCGGNRTDIERQIDAYQDMKEFYRELVDDTAFHIDRFSGFRELQQPRVKESIFEAGLELKDFGEWIRYGKIYRLEDVRRLPKVLSDDDAKNMFLNGGPNSIKDAIKLVDKKAENKLRQTAGDLKLDTASMFQLAEVLARRINELPYSELRALRNQEHTEIAEQIRCFEELSERLLDLLEYVSE